MRRVALGLAVFFSLPAHAAFLQPQCIDVSANRFDRAHVVGIGTITKMACRCTDTQLKCDKTLFLNEITKGHAPSTVRVFETFDLDFQITPVYCREVERSISQQIGQKEIYFLQEGKGGYTALPAQTCIMP